MTISGELLNFQRSMSFPRGNHTHTEGCSTAASTSSSVSSHTNRICNLRNSNGRVSFCSRLMFAAITAFGRDQSYVFCFTGAIESFDGKSTSEMLEETRDSDIADSPSPAPAIPEGKGTVIGRASYMISSKCQLKHWQQRFHPEVGYH